MIESVCKALYTDGIASLRGGFSRTWAQAMREDVDRAFLDAMKRPNGALPRGPQRYYVAIHPGQLRGYSELLMHPWVVGICEAVLGHQFQIVELGFEVPFPGAQNQPWHRDMPMLKPSCDERRLTSLSFSLTTVDTTPDMGPIEIAPGTQWEADDSWDHCLFPPDREWERYAATAQPRLSKAGDISVRSAQTIHRGTANLSSQPRPVLVLGVDAPGARRANVHEQQVTRLQYASLPAYVRQHLVCRVVDRLEPALQQPRTDGLTSAALS